MAEELSKNFETLQLHAGKLFQLIGSHTTYNTPRPYSRLSNKFPCCANLRNHGMSFTFHDSLPKTMADFDSPSPSMTPLTPQDCLVSRSLVTSTAALEILLLVNITNLQKSDNINDRA